MQRYDFVTPFVGVWIETISFTKRFTPVSVTPFVGVWIETYHILFLIGANEVTPFVGVWIETLHSARKAFSFLRHTLRGCVD